MKEFINSYHSGKEVNDTEQSQETEQGLDVITENASDKNEKIDDNSEVYFAEAEKYIKTSDLESAKCAFLLISGQDKNFQQGVLLQKYPEFRDFYEKSQVQEAQAWLENNPGIHADFNPSEDVKKILKEESGAARQHALAEYKDNLRKQKEAIANITVYAESIFRYNPEITEEEFNKKIEEYSSKFALTEEKQELFIDAFKRFQQNNKVVKNLLEKFSDNKELYKHMFGVEADQELQVLSRSGTLAFRCQDDKDYLKMKPPAMAEGFFAYRDTQDENGQKIRVPLIGEYGGGEYYQKIPSYTFSTTLIHEEQHALKSLFTKPSYQMHSLDKNFSELDPEMQKIEIDKYLDYKAEKISFDRAADEILAQFKGTPAVAEYLENYLLPYDFTGNLAENNKAYLVTHFKDAKLPEDLSKHIDEYVADNYKTTLSGGIKAVQDLYKFYEDPHKVTGLLLNEQMKNWPKIARRVMEKNI